MSPEAWVFPAQVKQLQYKSRWSPLDTCVVRHTLQVLSHLNFTNDLTWEILSLSPFFR